MQHEAVQPQERFDALARRFLVAFDERFAFRDFLEVRSAEGEAAQDVIRPTGGLDRSKVVRSKRKCDVGTRLFVGRGALGVGAKMSGRSF